jgi:hypothetical protein
MIWPSSWLDIWIFAQKLGGLMSYDLSTCHSTQTSLSAAKHGSNKNSFEAIQFHPFDVSGGFGIVLKLSFGHHVSRISGICIKVWLAELKF